MAAKKHDLPAMPFYFGDWRKAPEIRALDLDVRMIWFEMLGFMWESGERGYLTINGKPVITKVLTNILGVTPDVMERAMQQLEEFDVFSRREDGAIYCRRMVKDEEIRQLRAKAGTKGMHSRYNKKVKPVITKPITNTENETEIENVSENETGNANEAENGSGLIYQMHQLWLNAWPDYIPDDMKDITALRGISIKLKRLVEKKNKGSGEIRAATDSEVINAFEYIITNYPKWYRDNLISLSGLNSKFNDLIATLQKKTDHDEQSAKDLAYILFSDY